MAGKTQKGITVKNNVTEQLQKRIIVKSFVTEQLQKGLIDMSDGDSWVRFKSSCERLGIILSDDQIQKFQTFYEHLIEKNKVMNLTAITELDDVIDRHFIDSLSLRRVCDPEMIHSLLDLGTGAGFPGIPLAIVYPGLQICLVDSLNKRVGFLNEMIRILNLENCTAVHGRAEDLAALPLYREKFDVCVSRAVSAMNVLSEYCLPFVRTGGTFIAYKGNQVDEEVKAAARSIKVLGGKLVKCEEFELDDTGYRRTFIVINKTAKTPSRYPRKAGTPAKDPI